MRLSEFETSSRREYYGLILFAWARYKRGEIPTPGEFDYIQKRVWKKHPNAELVGMKRSCIARLKPTEPEEVWWEFKWVDYKNTNEDSNGNANDK